MGNFRREVFFGTPCIEQYFMVLSCIDTVVVILSDWCDTGAGTTEIQSEHLKMWLVWFLDFHRLKSYKDQNTRPKYTKR